MLATTFKSFNDSNKQGTFIVPLPNVLLMNRKNFYNFTFNFLQHESFGTLSVVMYFKRNFNLAAEINRGVKHLQATGLIDYWHYKFLDIRKESGTKSRKLLKLNVSQMKGAFEIWICGCLVSLTTFGVEKVVKAVKTFCNKKSYDSFNNIQY